MTTVNNTTIVAEMHLRKPKHSNIANYGIFSELQIIINEAKD